MSRDGHEEKPLSPHSSRVALARSTAPVFADRCVVCGFEGPGSTARIVSRDPSAWHALWAGWWTARVPCCDLCSVSLHVRRLFRFIRTILVAGLWLAIGIVWLLPRLPGWACGLIVLGLCVVSLGGLGIWEWYHPPAFTVVVRQSEVEYQFRTVAAAVEFAALNGATDIRTEF